MRLPMPLMLRQVLAFWRKEWLALARDWHGLLVLFVMPATFILIMSLALRDAIHPEHLTPPAVALVVQDSSPAGRHFALSLREEQRAWTIRQQAGRLDDVRAAVHSGELRAAIVVPPGLSDRLLGDTEQGAAVQVWLDPATPPLQRIAVETRLAAALGHAQAELGLKQMRAQNPALAEFDLPPAAAVEVRFAGERQRQPNAVEQSVPAWLVFAIFFVVIPISTVVITERRFGTLARLKTQRVSPFAIVLGKVLPYFVINQIQILLMLLLGRYGVPLAGGESLSLDVHWSALLLVGAALSIAGTGWALLVASLCRTTEQATIIGGVGNILAAALGGIMVPQFIMPPFMQQIATLSPMNWGLQAYLDVFLRAGTLTSVFPHALRLALFGLLALVLAAWCLSRSTHRT